MEQDIIYYILMLEDLKHFLLSYDWKLKWYVFPFVISPTLLLWPLWNSLYTPVIAPHTSIHFFKTNFPWKPAHIYQHKFAIRPNKVLHANLYEFASGCTYTGASVYIPNQLWGFWVCTQTWLAGLLKHRAHVFWWYESWPHLHANRSPRLTGSTCEGEARLHSNMLLWLLNTFTNVLMQN